MKMIFRYLNTLPWTKPLAIITSIVVILTFFLSWAFARDVPPNTSDMIKWFASTLVAASVGKSGYEGAKKNDKDPI